MTGVESRSTASTMERGDVEATLDRCEKSLAEGRPLDLKGIGFWKAVHAVERHPRWIPDLADRIGAIDRQVFEDAVHERLPLAWAIPGLTIYAGLGGFLVAAAAVVPRGLRGPSLFAGTMLLLASTHGLGHYLAGKTLGIRFTNMYFGGPVRREPSLKIDYASYLRRPPLARAGMHAAGALVTKAVPFAVLAVARGERAPRWVTTGLTILGAALIASDVLFSTRYSDWKRVIRQLRLARELRTSQDEGIQKTA